MISRFNYKETDSLGGINRRPITADYQILR